MTPTSPEPEHPVDRAVREHLEREAARVDAKAMLSRVRHARPATVPSSRRAWLTWASGVVTGAAVAAGVIFAFFLTPHETTKLATAAEVVEQARVTHAAPTDRCYDVTAEWYRDPFQKEKLEPTTQESRLWTRGDQFWISTAGPQGNRVAWGQDKAGKLWIALGPKRGLQYDPAEVGEPVLRYCDLMSLRVVSTLSDLLQGYELKRRDVGKPGEPIQIEANLRAAPFNPTPRFSRVALELDPDTKVIRRAELTRQLNGETVGKLTFTLVDTGNLPDDQYDLRGHLDDDATVLDGKFALPGMGPPKGDARTKFRDDFLRRIQGQPRPWEKKKD